MKLLFWILAVLSIPVGLFVSIVCYLSRGLGLTGTVIGEVVCIVGMPSLVVSIICAVLGILRLRKGDVKKAVAFALTGILYSCVIIAGYYIDNAVDTMLLEKDIAARNDQLYGENWNAPSALEDIPELYREELNKYYAAVRDCWSADQLMELGAKTMAEHYGDAPLDNIGFILMDVNSDGINELLIGTTSPVEESGTAIFCMYSDPENPFFNLTSVEGETYYLHYGETADTYMAEIVGADAAWLFEAEAGESIVGITYREMVLNPADRLTLEMVPFSRYK